MDVNQNQGDQGLGTETNNAEDTTSLLDALQAQAAESDVEDVEISQTAEATEEPELEFDFGDEDEEETEEVETEDSEGTPKPDEAYVPNFEYKAMGEVYEFDEELKGLITNKETEEKYRSILAKAKGLDFYEEKHKRLEDTHADLSVNFDTLQTDARELAQVVEKFNTHTNSDNVTDNYRALAEVGISDNKILNIAKHVLQLQKLAPSQRQAYDNQFVQQNQLEQTRAELAQTKQSVQQSARQMAQFEFNSFKTANNDVVEEYNTRQGNQPGSFTADFINFGVGLEKRLGKDLDHATVLTEFKRIQNLGRAKKVEPVAKKKVPPIPNLKGSGHSPVSKGFNSMSDFNKFRDDNNL